MIVYRDFREQVSSLSVVGRMRRLVAAMQEPGGCTHDRAVELLIESGELETGLADVENPERDGWSGRQQTMRCFTCAAARVVCRTWRGTPANDLVRNVVPELLQRVGSLEMPPYIPLSVPEGFVYYGLYPETYIEAAARLVVERKPDAVACIGLRSIGTSLGAAVSATLAEMGVEVDSYTVRPRGHPFDRQLVLTHSFAETLSRHNNALVAIVDEGPGLSGSSLTGAAAALIGMGIAGDRIVFFPSWAPDSAPFMSERGRSIWSGSAKYVDDFSDVWIRSGRLQTSTGLANLEDISGGNWRARVFGSPAEYPATHPHHERRKYLAHDPAGEGKLLMKFVGLGRYGRKLYTRAKTLGEAGFGPRLRGLRSGFLIMEFKPGRPLSPRHRSPELLSRAARYFRFLAQTFPGTLTATYAKMREMIRENVREGLGEEYTARLRYLDLITERLYGERIVEVDGKHMPHDWLEARGQHIKTDHLEHHFDQFFPGCQNILWDVAGFSIEFGLSHDEQNLVLDSLEQERGDSRQRIAFYRTAYLAYRLGYTTLAAQSLEPGGESDAFRGLTCRYGALLREEIERNSANIMKGIA